MARDGLEAIAQANAEPPDLVLLDVQLPDLDGFEVCQRLRARWPAPEMPVLFVSATRDVQDKVRGFRLGGVDFVTKPFQFDEMVARVETHLDLKRLQQQAASRTRELEAVNERLRKLEAARSSFLSAVVHDLKNPLTPVLKNTEWLLAQSHAEEGESGDVLKDLYLAANHMNRMVLSLLDVARGSEAVLEPRAVPVRLGTWAAEAVALARLHLRSTPTRLCLEVEDGLACFDPVLMTRVLQNLLDNALKYSPRGTAVRVRVTPLDAGGLAVVVEDAGTGIPEWARQRVFEPWARIEQGEDPYARVSHGLGLAFCRQAVEAHGGHIHVEDAVPHGARFVIAVPPRYAPRAPKAAVAAAGAEE